MTSSTTRFGFAMSNTKIYGPQPPGNYVTRYNDQFKSKSSHQFNPRAYNELVDLGHRMANEAACWTITNIVRDFISKTELPHDILKDWRLPYPEMAIEWCATWDVEAVMKYRSPDEIYVPALERIIHVVDIEHQTSLNPAAIKDADATTLDCFLVRSFCRQPGITEQQSPIQWIANPVMLLVPYAAFNDLRKWLER